MKIELHPSFEKFYNKRIARNPKLAAKTSERIALFVKDPYHPLLLNHVLEGKKAHLRAFSVAGDIRIVYFLIGKDHALFLDIGTHNQVY